ncbi:substrate-binding periplasmic protein [Benzoatithermus flavus]|uniref:Transporter substrate-binding domain-containing protein n=1 Tax=Benzoatithermus flavus TaxID=3108223 RepID=A0ABU8XU82_9PROT
MTARRRLLAGLCGLGAFGLARPILARTYADTVNTVGENLDELRAKGRIRIAFYRDFAPFSYEDADGHWAGIDVEIAGLIAKSLGLGLDLMPIQAGETVDDDLRNAVWRGTPIDKSWANLLLHVPVSRELEVRNELVAIFGAYHVEKLALALDPARIEGGAFSLDLLSGHTIGVELDTLGDFYLSMTAGGRFREATRRFHGTGEAVAALVAGEVAAVIAPAGQIEGLLGPERGRFELLTDVFPGLAVTSWSVGCAVRENARDLGYAVGDIVAAAVKNGTMAGIFGRHGVTYRAPVVME